MRPQESRLALWESSPPARGKLTEETRSIEMPYTIVKVSDLCALGGD